MVCPFEDHTLHVSGQHRQPIDQCKGSMVGGGRRERWSHTAPVARQSSCSSAPRFFSGVTTWTCVTMAPSQVSKSLPTSSFATFLASLAFFMALWASENFFRRFAKENP
jgi:hypothetical protein